MISFFYKGKKEKTIEKKRIGPNLAELTTATLFYPQEVGLADQKRWLPNELSWFALKSSFSIIITKPLITADLCP